MKKARIFLLVFILLFTSCIPCFASPNGGNPSTVSADMTNSDFWKDNASEDPEKVLLLPEEIQAYNAMFMEDSTDTLVRDLENMTPEYDATKVMQSLIAEAAAPTLQYYVDGKAIDNEEYYRAIRSDIEKTAYRGTRNIQYAVVSTHADIKAIPTRDMLMDSLTDTADEMQSSAMLVNEPFIIKQKCEREGTTFYWGYSQNVTGWVDGANLAICKGRDEWLAAWKINDFTAKDFIVITQDKVYLDKSTDPTYPAGLYLGLGTTLKLVEPENIPVTVGERGTWSNYVVYIPGRDEKGKYVQKMGLIASHYSVHEGYMPYTQANILDLAFSCQGNRYGWGNMFGNTDCSGYIRNILRCFGFNFPRNTTTQRKIEGTDVDLRGFKNSELTAFLKTIPVGSLLYISGHAMIYIGTVNDIPYVISSTAILSDPEGDIKTVKYLSVLVTPLTVRKANGSTWLYLLQDAVVLPRKENIASFDVTAYKKKGADDSRAVVAVASNGKTLKKGTDFIVTKPAEGGYEGYCTVIGTGSYTGISRIRISYPGCIYTYTDLKSSAWYANAVKYVIDKGYMVGTSAEKFQPDVGLTKAQLASVLYKVAGNPAVSVDTEGYTDVNEPVTRISLIQGMYRLSGGAYEYEEDVLSGFSDTYALSESEAEALAWAVANGLVHGYSDGTIKPDRFVSRAEFAGVLYNYMHRSAK